MKQDKESRRAVMDRTHFNILAATRNAYAFVWRERLYLARLGLLPVLLQIATSFFIAFTRPEASVLEACLWNLPSTLFYGWFAFAVARCLLLGERIGAIHPDMQDDRRRAMTAAVILTGLVNMGVNALAAFLLLTVSNPTKGGAGAVFIQLLIIGWAFWALRLTVLPLVAAVGYPLRALLRRVAGLLFSLRLAALGLLCALPVQFLLGLLFDILSIEPRTATPQKTALMLASAAPISLLLTALLTSAAAYALKDIFSKDAP